VRRDAIHRSESGPDAVGDFFRAHIDHGGLEFHPGEDPGARPGQRVLPPAQPHLGPSPTRGQIGHSRLEVALFEADHSHRNSLRLSQPGQSSSGQLRPIQRFQSWIWFNLAIQPEPPLILVAARTAGYHALIRKLLSQAF